MGKNNKNKITFYKKGDHLRSYLFFLEVELWIHIYCYCYLKRVTVFDELEIIFHQLRFFTINKEQLHVTGFGSWFLKAEILKVEVSATLTKKALLSMKACLYFGFVKIFYLGVSIDPTGQFKIYKVWFRAFSVRLSLHVLILVGSIVTPISFNGNFGPKVLIF